jgi:hypothetical protein
MRDLVFLLKLSIGSPLEIEVVWEAGEAKLISEHLRKYDGKVRL